MSIREILEAYRYKDAYTHAFVAYGRLKDSAPLLMEQVGTDNRRMFDLASLTKALVTVPLVFAQNRSLEETVFDWAPLLREQLRQELGQIQISSLLRHVSGLPAWRNFWMCRLGSPESLITRMKRSEMILEGLNRIEPKPDGRQVYSDVGFLLLGLALESRTEDDLSKQFQYFDHDFCFRPANPDACVPTAFCPVRNRLLTGEVHDENCAALGGVTGHAGLFGTGEAVCRFLHDFIQGTDIGQRILDAQVRALSSPPKQDFSQDSLLGWRQGSGPITSVFGQGLAVGHPGFTGTSFWIDPYIGDYIVFLTNRVFFGRTSTVLINAVRAEVYSKIVRSVRSPKPL